MPGPTPITGIQPIQSFEDPTPFATPEERSGGTADPRHGVTGETARPYSWELTGGVQYPGHMGPVGQEAELIGFEFMEHPLPAGTLSQDPTGDMTPTTAAGGRKTHAAPWPKGVPMDMSPETTADRRQESYEIHSSDTGAGRDMLYAVPMDAQQDTWQDFYRVDSGDSLQVPLARVTHAQVGTVSGTFTSRDRAQSLAQQNEYGFDSMHAHRRYAQSPIPGNYMWMQPGGRPMHKTIPGTAKLPTGPNSPFAGQDGGASFGQFGAVLSTLPGEYVAPPEPALAAPAYSADASQGVDLW